MSPYLIAGLASALIGGAITFGITHEIDGAALAREQAAHAKDNKANADTLAAINSASAKQLADALTKQQAAEGKVSELETNFQNEVNAHASDSLKYRADLASGAQRLRVRVASCDSGSTSGQSSTATGSPDGSAAFADLYGPTASGVFKVTEDDQKEIDKLSGLQAYVKTLQDHGYISK